MSKTRLWEKLGFRGKVLFAMGAVVIPILLLMAGFSYSYSKNLFETQMQKELELENEIVAQEIYTLLISKVEIADHLGALDDVRDFAESPVERQAVKTSDIYPNVNQIF